MKSSRSAFPFQLFIGIGVLVLLAVGFIVLPATVRCPAYYHPGAINPEMCVPCEGKERTSLFRKWKYQLQSQYYPWTYW